MAYLGPVEIAGGTFELDRDACPYDVELDLVPASQVPNTDAVRTLSGPVVFTWLEGEDRMRIGVPFGTAFPTTWYVVPDQNGIVRWPEKRYHLGLDKVIQYARGATSYESIARRVNMGIAREVCYFADEDLYPWWEVLGAYEDSDGVQCNTHVDLMLHLLRTSGIPGWKELSWGGLPDALYEYRLREGETPVSFQLRAPLTNRVPADPHFYHHAVARVLVTIFDPSYGTYWIPTALECAPNASQQTGVRLPDARLPTPWRCNHSWPAPIESCP